MGGAFQAARPAHEKSSTGEMEQVKELRKIQRSQNKGIKGIHIRSEAEETGRAQTVGTLSAS